MATKRPENMPFEASVSELEHIISTLEAGDLSLEDSLKQFERGVALARSSQEKLEQAEQKIKILLNQQGEESLQDFKGNHLDND